MPARFNRADDPSAPDTVLNAARDPRAPALSNVLEPDRLRARLHACAGFGLIAARSLVYQRHTESKRCGRSVFAWRYLTTQAMRAYRRMYRPYVRYRTYRILRWINLQKPAPG